MAKETKTHSVVLTIILLFAVLLACSASCGTERPACQPCLEEAAQIRPDYDPHGAVLPILLCDPYNSRGEADREEIASAANYYLPPHIRVRAALPGETCGTPCIVLVPGPYPPWRNPNGVPWHAPWWNGATWGFYSEIYLDGGNLSSGFECTKMERNARIGLIVAHEALHQGGYPHSADPHSVMYFSWNPTWCEEGALPYQVGQD